MATWVAIASVGDLVGGTSSVFALTQALTVTTNNTKTNAPKISLRQGGPSGMCGTGLKSRDKMEPPCSLRSGACDSHQDSSMIWREGELLLSYNPPKLLPQKAI